MPPDLVPINHRDLPVYLSEREVEQARAYSEHMMWEEKEHLLRARGQSQALKYQLDCFYSQLGEIAVSRALQDLGCSPPTGHVPGKRDWEPDHQFTLDGKTYYLHTKSQTRESEARYGTAWLIGHGAGQDRRIYEFHAEDYLVLTTVTKPSLVYLRAILPITHLRDLALVTEEGIEPRLRHSKRCVRLSHIDSLGLKRFQLPAPS